MVTEVRFEGLKNVGRDKQPTDLATRVGQPWTATQVEKDAQSLLDTGYLFSVQPKVNPGATGDVITFVMVENPVVTAIEFVGNTVFSTDALRDGMKTKPGQVLNNQVARSDLLAIQDRYHGGGYPYAAVLDVKADQKTGVLRIMIGEGTVESIKIDGNRVTRGSIITGLLTTRPGVPFNATRWNADLKTLTDLGIFSNLRWDAAPGASAASKVLVLKLEEQSVIGLNMELEAKAVPSYGLIIVDSQPADLSPEISAVLARMAAAPRDPLLYEQLGALYREEELFKPAAAASTRAEELYREKLKERPHDGLLLVGLGRTLQGMDRTEEAGRVLRQAVKEAPQQPQAWSALGDFLVHTALYKTLWSQTTGFVRQQLNEQHAGNAAIAAAAAKLPPPTTPEELAKARQQLSEAANAYNRAATLAPQDWRVYVARGIARFEFSLVGSITRAIQSASGASAIASFNLAGAASDLSHAARLDPEDPAAQLQAAVVSFMAVMASRAKAASDSNSDKSGQSTDSENGFPKLTAAERQALDPLRQRLLQIGSARDPHRAVNALAALTFLGILEGDRQKVVATAQQALARDPAGASGEAAVLIALRAHEDWDRLEQFCAHRLKLHRTPEEALRLRLFAADADLHTNKEDAADQEIEDAERLKARSFDDNLALAELILKRYTGPAAFAAAKTAIDAAAAGTPDPDQNQAQKLSAIRSLYAALADRRVETLPD